MVEGLKRVECFRQIGQEIMNPEIKIPRWSKNGERDCSTCIYDPENNQKCKDYIPLRSLYLNVHKIENIVEHSQNI